MVNPGMRKFLCNNVRWLAIGTKQNGYSSVRRAEATWVLTLPPLKLFLKVKWLILRFLLKLGGFTSGFQSS